MGLETVENQYLDGRTVLNCSDRTAAEVDDEVKLVLKDAYAKVKDMLAQNREVLDKVADFLIEKETITGKEFMEIFNEVKGITPDTSENTESAKNAEAENEEASAQDEAECDDVEIKEAADEKTEQNANEASQETDKQD